MKTFFARPLALLTVMTLVMSACGKEPGGTSDGLAAYEGTPPMRSTKFPAPPPRPGAWVYKNVMEGGLLGRAITRIAIRGVRDDGMIRLLWAEEVDDVRLENSTWWNPKSGRYLQQSKISRGSESKKTCEQKPFVHELKIPIKNKMSWVSNVKCEGAKSSYSFKVVAREKVTVPAGEFDTYKVVASREGKILSTRWYSAELRMDVKYNDTRDSRELAQLPTI